MPVLARFPKSLLGIMVLAAGVELAKVGQSLDEGRDLWEEVEEEQEEEGEGGRDKRRKRREDERRDRWMVMLVTVAGCLAFKNDAVGFVAGMVWHWGLSIPDWSQGLSRRLGRYSGASSRTRMNTIDEEGESLLSRNHDGPEGRMT